MSTNEPTLVVGVGNADRGDDALGLVVARALAVRAPPGVAVEEVTGDLTSLLDLWQARRLAVVVDAVRSARPPGTLSRWDLAGPAPVPPPRGTSTHGLSLSDAIHLGRSLGQWPDRLVLYGIEAGETALGGSLSPAVASAVPGVVARILREISETPSPGGR